MADTEEFKVLKNSKKNIKSRLTRFKNFIQSLISNDQGKDLKELDLRIKSVEPLLDSFYEIQNKIQSIDESISEDILNSETADFENIFFEFVGKGKQILELKLNEVNDNNIDDNESVSARSTFQSNVRLPPIPLPSGGFSIRSLGQ